MHRVFLLATWCDGKEVAISIGRKHKLWFPISYLMWRKGSSDFYWSQTCTGFFCWLPDVMERKSQFLLVASTNCDFLLATWCDVKEVAISIGHRHAQGFSVGYLMWWKGSRNFYRSQAQTVVSYWLSDVTGGKPCFSIGHRHEQVFPIGYLMWREVSRVFLLVAGMNCGFLLATWCDGREAVFFYWSQAWTESFLLATWCDGREAVFFYWSQARTESFRLATWCDGKKVAISIGHMHELWFPIGYLKWWKGSRDLYWSQAQTLVSYWLPDVTGGKPYFSIGRRHGGGFLLVTWCDGREAVFFYWPPVLPLAWGGSDFENPRSTGLNHWKVKNLWNIDRKQ
jgi:hypothetical protein